MKKIIQTVADGGGELGVHMYPLKNRDIVVIVLYYLYKWVFQKVLKLDESVGWMQLEHFQKLTSANYFQSEWQTDKYSTLAPVWMWLTPPKQKISLVLTKAYCSVANQMREFCE